MVELLNLHDFGLNYFLGQSSIYATNTVPLATLVLPLQMRLSEVGFPRRRGVRLPRKKKILPNAVLSADDIKLLKFLWKWKVSTSMALSKKFYPHKNLRRAYERLKVLEKAAFIQSHREIKGEKFIWTLAKKGFLTIEHHLGELKQQGFLPLSPGHDLLCAAVLQAESVDDWVSLVTDQELLRSHTPGIELYSSFHRADGYWVFENDVVALEVQISSQKTKDFHLVALFYANIPTVHAILWVLSKITMAKGIYTGLSDAKEKGIERHQFVSFESFFESGWDAEIEVGTMAGTKIREILKANGSASSFQKLALDTRKSPHTAKTPLYYEPGDLWVLEGKK